MTYIRAPHRCPRPCSVCYPPPVEQSDPTARRVAWILYAWAAVIVFGLLAYACASCARPPTQPAIKAPPPAYGHRVVGT